MQFRGIPALITLDRHSRDPIYRQIYDAYRARILRNELRAGQLVPSSRDLARHLRSRACPSSMPTRNSLQKASSKRASAPELSSQRFPHAPRLTLAPMHPLGAAASHNVPPHSNHICGRPGPNVSDHSKLDSPSCNRFRFRSGRASPPVTRANLRSEPCNTEILSASKNSAKPWPPIYAARAGCAAKPRRS